MSTLSLWGRPGRGRRHGAGLGRLAPLALIFVLSAHWLLAEEMVTRFYPVEAGVLDRARPRHRPASISLDDDADDSDAITDEWGRFNLQGFFEGLGVDFPRGSRIGYNCRVSKLIVTSTRENLERIETILHEIDPPFTQVCLDVRVVRLPWAELDRVTQGARASAVAADNTVLLLRGTTRPGNTMVMEETTGAGPARLAVDFTPTVAANLHEIDLELSVVLHRTPHDPTKIETKLIVEDGVPYMLSCSGPHRGAEEGGTQRYVECLTVTATLVTSAGELWKQSRRDAEPARVEP